MNAAKSRMNIGILFKLKESSAPNIKELTAKAEPLMVGFMAEHRTPFAQADHTVDMSKAMFPEKAIAQNMKLKHTQGSYVMQDGVAL